DRHHVRRRVARSPHPRRVQRAGVVPGGDVPGRRAGPAPHLRRRVPGARAGVARRPRGARCAPRRRALSEATVVDGRILVGTCSWTDKTLTDETDWYPKKSMTAAERLAYYSARYPVVEADSTYYFPPSRQLTTSWVERTPKDFTMNVKAYSLLTGHPTRP